MNASNQASRYAYEQAVAGRKEYVAAATALSDCAEVAGTAAKLTARGSPMAEHVRDALAKCCDAAVAECEKLKDPKLSPCVEACRKAAHDCREMQKLSSSR